MIRDLLNPSSGFLELREDGRGVVVAGISEVQAKKTSEVSNLIHLFHPKLVSDLFNTLLQCTCTTSLKDTILFWNLWSMSY